jgi:DNA-binding IclR family transcriptional regulator
MNLLEDGPKRYSELVRLLKRPDKTVYVTLRALASLNLATKDAAGKYSLTHKGRQELIRMRLVRAVELEDNPEVVSRLSETYHTLRRGLAEPESARPEEGVRPWRESSSGCL